MKKESTKSFPSFDRFLYFISALPSDISYSILSSVKSFIDLISVCVSDVTPAQIISFPTPANPAWPDTVTPSSRTRTTINHTTPLLFRSFPSGGRYLDHRLSILQTPSLQPAYLPEKQAIQAALRMSRQKQWPYCRLRHGHNSEHFHPMLHS